jgi:O-antigen/teichoic acid export membrane protein
LLFAVGNGIMQPLEQEVARAVSDRRVKGIGPAPVIRRAVIIGIGFAAFAAAVSFILGGSVLSGPFNDDRVLIASFALGLFAFGAGHLTRGVLSSHHRFGGYARFFSFDGVSRVVLVGALAMAGVSMVGPYGLVLALTPFIGVAAAMVGQKGLMEPGPEAEWSELTTKLGWLLLGTVSIALVVQGGTIAVEILATPEQDAAAGVFLNGLQTARIPLFLFQAVLASLLPKLSRLIGGGHFDEFLVTLRRLVLAILGLGVVTTILATVFGPIFIEKVYGSTDVLGPRDLALLSTAFILIMATICLDQALIALNGHSRMAIGWFVALGVFVGVTALGSDLFLRVELGLLASSIFAFAWMGILLAERLRHHARPHAVDEAEALAEIPLP